MRAPVSSRHPVAPEVQSEPTPPETIRAQAEWLPLFEQGVQPLTDRLLSLAGVEVGQRVLDVAAGTGETALNAARLVGASGAVVALEDSGDLLEITRKRAAQSGLSNLSLVEQAGEELDYPAESFDAAFCRWGLPLADALPKTLRRVNTLLKSGGHFAVAVWFASPKVPLLSLPGAIIAQSLRLPPRSGDPAFGLSNRHALTHAFGQTGFVKVRSEVLSITVSFAGEAAYTHFLQAFSPYLVAMLEALPAEKRAELWQAVGEAARQRYAGPDGILRIPGETICVAGQRP